MWKVVFLACVASLIVTTHHQSAQSSSYSFASSSSGASSCGGRCAKPKQCNNPNEKFDPCPATCPPQQCGVDPALVLCAPGPRPGDPACQPGCRCVDGYVRDERNQCIPRDSCPKCTGQNEFFDTCISGCSNQSCDSIGKVLECPIQAAVCRTGCRCQDGFYRNANNICVPESDCPKPGCNGDPNATPGCGINCGRTCSTYNSSEPQFCIQECKENGCDCIKGYVFDDTQGRCVLPKDCSKPGCNGDSNASPGCGVNCGRTCATYNSSEPVACIKICYPDGCDCNEGYVFDDVQKRCVLPEQCSKPGCNGDPNASPGCGVNCGRTCTTYNSPEPVACILVCYENGCDCNDGYVFDDTQKKCVLPGDCSKPGCNGDPNAKPGCGVNCGRTCSTYDKGPVACPLVCALNGCDCVDGYVYDPDVRKCVLPGDCTPQCGLNEIPSNCSNGGCGPFACSDLGYPIKCVKPQTCQKGCVCQNTYVRSANGTCIPKDQCTGSCGGDPNAVPGCGVNCGRTCDTYNSEPQFCPAICKENGCDCKRGYVFDDNRKKCVLPKKCTPKCSSNEHYCPCCRRCVCHPNYSRPGGATCVRNG